MGIFSPRIKQVDIVIRPPFASLGVAIEFVKKEREIKVVKDATYNTLTFTPVILVDSETDRAMLCNLSFAIDYFIDKSTLAEFIELNKRSAYVQAAGVISDTSSVIRNAMKQGNSGWVKSHNSAPLSYNRGQENGEALRRAIVNSCGIGQMDNDIVFGPPNDAGITFDVSPRINEGVKVVNMHRLTEWYNHMMSACSTVELPIQKRTEVSVWTADRISPDVIAKNVRKLAFEKSKGHWVSWLSGDFIILDVAGQLKPAPSWSIKTWSHMMHVLDNEAGVYDESQGVRIIRFMGKNFKFTGQWEHAEAGVGSRYLITDEIVTGNVKPFSLDDDSELCWIGNKN